MKLKALTTNVKDSHSSISKEELGLVGRMVMVLNSSLLDREASLP